MPLFLLFSLNDLKSVSCEYISAIDFVVVKHLESSTYKERFNIVNKAYLSVEKVDFTKT